jgi:hypothetical protein
MELQKFLNDLVTDSPHLGRVRIAPTSAATLEAVDFLRSTLSRSQRSKVLNALIVVQGMDVLEAVAIGEAEDELLQIQASIVTRRDTVFSNARSLRAKLRSTLPTRRNDGGKAALRTIWSNSLHLLPVLIHY